MKVCVGLDFGNWIWSVKMDWKIELKCGLIEFVCFHLFFWLDIQCFKEKEKKEQKKTKNKKEINLFKPNKKQTNSIIWLINLRCDFNFLFSIIDFFVFVIYFDLFLVYYLKLDFDCIFKIIIDSKFQIIEWYHLFQFYSNKNRKSKKQKSFFFLLLFFFSLIIIFQKSTLTMISKSTN